MFKKTNVYQREWLGRRRNLPCRTCGYKRSDPVSLLCVRCFMRWRRHGSPIVEKPRLEEEMKEAEDVLSGYDLSATRNAFNRWMETYAEVSSKEPLRRLCGLHFQYLRHEDGMPLMSFDGALLQTLAVSIYEERGGAMDADRKQFQYLLGRASVSTWRGRRKAKDGTEYDREARKRLQRRPRLFHQAFSEVFLGAGIGRVLAFVRNNRKRRIAQ